MSLVTTIFTHSAIADIYDGERTIGDILAYVTSEVGELADEVLIASGRSYKEAGKDGIVGEGIDAIICILDLIKKQCPAITEEQLIEIAQAKCGKWIGNLHGKP